MSDVDLDQIDRAREGAPRPCPFCRAAATIWTDRTHAPRLLYSIEVDHAATCGLAGELNPFEGWDDLGQLIIAWNARPVEDALARELREAREMIKRIQQLHNDYGATPCDDGLAMWNDLQRVLHGGTARISETT
jgi:hypothetical protein